MPVLFLKKKYSQKVRQNIFGTVFDTDLVS